MFSASDVAKGKPSPDLFLHAARKMGIWIGSYGGEDSPADISAATAAGMMSIGFVGGSHAGPNLGAYLTSAGARVVIADMRALKSTVVALRGW